LTTGQLRVAGPLNITGPGSGLLTIDGNLRSRIFLFDNGNASINHHKLSGVTLTRGVANNSASLAGGGIDAANGALGPAHVVIAGNKSGGGGGINVRFGGFLLLDNSTVSGNNATLGGGGLFFDGGSTGYIRNSTISGNLAGIRNDSGRPGGGIFF